MKKIYKKLKKHHLMYRKIRTPVVAILCSICMDKLQATLQSS